MKTGGIFALLCALALLVCAAGCSSAPQGHVDVPTPDPSTDGSGSESDFKETPVLDGERGETYKFGSLVYTMVSEEEVERAALEGGTVSGVENMETMKRMDSTLSGVSRTELFDTTQRNPYAKIWVSLEEASDTVFFSITKSSPTDPPLGPGCVVKIPAGRSVSVLCTEALEPDLYFANFTSDTTEMAGTAVCRVAAGPEELDLR